MYLQNFFSLFLSFNIKSKTKDFLISSLVVKYISQSRFLNNFLHIFCAPRAAHWCRHSSSFFRGSMGKARCTIGYFEACETSKILHQCALLEYLFVFISFLCPLMLPSFFATLLHSFHAVLHHLRRYINEILILVFKSRIAL